MYVSNIFFALIIYFSTQVKLANGGGICFLNYISVERIERDDLCINLTNTMSFLFASMKGTQRQCRIKKKQFSFLWYLSCISMCFSRHHLGQTGSKRFPVGRCPFISRYTRVSITQFRPVTLSYMLRHGGQRGPNRSCAKVRIQQRPSEDVFFFSLSFSCAYVCGMGKRFLSSLVPVHP